MLKMKYCIIYVPCADTKEAKKISKALLEKHLVACCKLFPIQSMYWWKGKIDTNESEIVLMIETREDKFNEIEETVNELHSYEMPLVFSTPINNINKGAANWIDKSIE